MTNKNENQKTDDMLNKIAGRTLELIALRDKRDGVLLDVAADAIAVASAAHDFLGYVDMGIENGAFAADSEYVEAAEKLREDIEARMRFVG